MGSVFSKDFKSELTVGKISSKILVTIFVGAGWYYIQNLYEYIPRIYKSISQSLYDDMIVGAAHGPKDYDAIIVGFIFYLSTILICAIAVFGFVRISLLIKRELEEDDISTMTSEVFIKKMRMLRFTYGIMSILSILLFIGTQFANSAVEAQAEMVRDFNRKVCIITPYVETIVKDRLISDFALMKGENDYLKINKKFELLFKQNNLKP
jgi:hypothetical protein